jgi:uncharacterized protein YbcC (UPF0753/DUF2309 family)
MLMTSKPEEEIMRDLRLALAKVGFSRDEQVELSEKLLRSVADLATFNNTFNNGVISRC